MTGIGRIGMELLGMDMGRMMILLLRSRWFRRGRKCMVGMLVILLRVRMECFELGVGHGILLYRYSMIRCRELYGFLISSRSVSDSIGISERDLRLYILDILTFSSLICEYIVNRIF
jgi:hypothetical protein